MPKFQYFDENKKLIEERQEPLNEKNIGRFIEMVGKERALGYLEALEEITETLDTILRQRHGVYSTPNSPAFIRRELRELHGRQDDFLQLDSVKTIITELKKKPE